MAYMQFLWKRAIKNPFILLSFFLSLLLILSFFFMNTIAKTDPFLSQMEQNQQVIQQSLAIYELEENEEEKVVYYQEILEEIAATQEAYLQQDYKQAYQQALKLNKKEEILQKNLMYSEEITEIWQQLALKNLPMEQVGKEKSAWLFLYRWLSSLFPLVVVVTVTFILTIIFSQSYHGKLNQDWLLPIGILKRKEIQFLFTISFLLIGYLLIGSFTFLISGILNGFQSSLYPITIYSSSGFTTLPVILVIKESLFLICLSIFALTATGMFLMQLFKNQLIAFFLTLLFYLGQAYLPETFKSFRRLAHLLPGYYLKAVEVVTGELAVISQNQQVTFEQGLFVVSVYLVSVLLLSFSLDFFHQRNQLRIK